MSLATTLLPSYITSDREACTDSFVTPSTDLFNYLIATPRAIDASCTYRDVADVETLRARRR